MRNVIQSQSEPANRVALAAALAILPDSPTSRRKRTKLAKKIMRRLLQRYGFRIVPIY